MNAPVQPGKGYAQHDERREDEAEVAEAGYCPGPEQQG